MEPKISVAIATFNEEKNIVRCLESLVDWVDEIVVVDGGSIDKTVEIASSIGRSQPEADQPLVEASGRKKPKVKVFVTDNPFIFHINKQKAIDRATSDWILQLDADEVVSPKLKEEIIKIINKNPKENGFWLPRKNYFLGRFLKKGGQYPDHTLRLYRRKKGRLPCKSVHEQAVVQGEVGYLKNPLLHYADPTFRRYLVRFNRYTSLLASEMVEEKVVLGPISLFNYFFVKPFWWFFLTFIRHKGFQDGFAGFIFSLFSSLRFPVAYIKYWEKKNEDCS